MKAMVLALTLGVVAVVTGGAMAATTSQAAKAQSFWLRGNVVSVTDSTMVVRVATAAKSITRYEQKGELTVVLAPKATIRMGKKAIEASMLKPNERVYVTGSYKPGSSPTFEATRIVVSGK